MSLRDRWVDWRRRGFIARGKLTRAERYGLAVIYVVQAKFSFGMDRANRPSSSECAAATERFARAHLAPLEEGLGVRGVGCLNPDAFPGAPLTLCCGLPTMPLHPTAGLNLLTRQLQPTIAGYGFGCEGREAGHVRHKCRLHSR
jgi:hypothetical protein